MAKTALSGDEIAFRELVDRYAKPILNFVARMTGSPTVAEELTQQVFVKAWTSRDTFRPRADARVSTWLFQIARHVALDELRATRRQPRLVDLSVEDVSAQRPSPAEAADQAELGRSIARAVSQLPDDQRTAFILAEYHGLPVREIALVEACTEKAIERRLHRARHFLRDALKDWRTQPRGTT